MEDYIDTPFLNDDFLGLILLKANTVLGFDIKSSTQKKIH